MPVAVEIRNRIQKHQEDISVQAQVLQQLISRSVDLKGTVNVKLVTQKILEMQKNEDTKNRYLPLIENEVNKNKKLFRKKLGLMLDNLDANFQELSSPNYSEFVIEFEANAQETYKYYLGQEIEQLKNILIILNKQALQVSKEVNDVYDFFMTATWLVDYCTTVLGYIDRIKVRYR